MKHQIIGSISSKSVLPTPTVLFAGSVLGWEKGCIEVANLDGSQTLSVLIYRRLTPASAWSLSPYDIFASIAPGASVAADLDLSATAELKLEGTASGAGLLASWAGILVR